MMDMLNIIFIARWCLLCAIAGGYVGVTYALMVLDTKNQDSAVKRLITTKIVLLSIWLLILVEFVVETFIRIL